MNSVRASIPDDLPRLVLILERVVKDMRAKGILQWDEAYPRGTDLTKDIERQELFILEQEGMPAGFIVLNEIQAPQYQEVEWLYPGKALVVHRLCVDPQYHGKKIGKSLMDFCEQRALDKQYDVIRLDTFSGNPIAISLYEKRGYRRSGIVSLRKDMLFFCFEKPVNPPTQEPIT